LWRNPVPVKLKKFFAELKRRDVYKVAIAYGVVAWLLMQIASQIFRCGNGNTSEPWATVLTISSISKTWNRIKLRSAEP
jgi:hypothetical protein